MKKLKEIKKKKFGKPKEENDDVMSSLEESGEEVLKNIDTAGEEVEKLIKLLEANLNYWTTFKLSMVRGFGAAIGATIIIAAAIYLLDRFFAVVGYIPVLTPILEYIYDWFAAAV